MNAALTNSTVLTPAQLERAKTREQRAEDIVYTVNHAISCGITDILIQPWASNWLRTNLDNNTLPKWMGPLERFMHTHDDHCHDGPGGHAKPAAAPVADKGKFWKDFAHNSQDWFVGEALGDVGGVVGTIAVQRYFPSLMAGIRTVIEPLAGWAFRGGAVRDAKNWGARHGYAEDSAETKAKAAELYEHEVSHLPQAVMWNLFSVPINIGVQYLLVRNRLSKEHGPAEFNQMWKQDNLWKKEVYNIGLSKAFGSVVSNGMLLGGRAVAPAAFGKMDGWTGKHIVMPATKLISKLGGVSEKEVEDALAKQEKQRAEREGDAKPTTRVEKDQLVASRVAQPEQAHGLSA